ncbi:MAG: hypothetical protein OXG79_04710 [Chloroflexi bacterium]|nr:hypothetical protein [Chloroflexota bacterium]
MTEGLWVVTVHFDDYDPPTVGTIPTANIDSRTGSGGTWWSVRSWNHIYVAADRDSAKEVGERMAVFTPGEVVVHISDLPDNVAWWVEFERLGELKLR